MTDTIDSQMTSPAANAEPHRDVPPHETPREALHEAAPGPEAAAGHEAGRDEPQTENVTLGEALIAADLEIPPDGPEALPHPDAETEAGEIAAPKLFPYD